MKIYEDYFSNNQEFLAAVVNWGTQKQPGKRKGESQRLLYRQRALGLNESVPSEGGWLVGADYGKEILTVLYKASQLAKFCSKNELKGVGPNEINLPLLDIQSRVDGQESGRPLQHYWKCEGMEKITSKMRFRKLALSLEKVMVLLLLTDELKDDIPLLEAYLRDEGGAELGFGLDEAIVRGSGAGMPLGILNSGCLIEQAKAGAQGADTIVLANFGDMWSRLWLPAKSRLDKVKWLIHGELDGQIWDLAEGANIIQLPPNSGYPTPSIMGAQVLWTEHNSVLGDVGDIILADMSAYQLIDKGSPKGTYSIHVSLEDPTSGFLTDETFMRMVYRVDGQSRQHRPITERRGTNTTSPFVTLQERT